MSLSQPPPASSSGLNLRKNIHDRKSKTEAAEQSNGHPKNDSEFKNHGGGRSHVDMTKGTLASMKYKTMCDIKEMKLKRDDRKKHLKDDDSSSDEVVPVLGKKPKLADHDHKRNFVATWLQSITFFPTESNQTEGKLRKSLAPTDSATPTPPSSTSSVSTSSSKRVSFAMAKNTEHDHRDYWNSVQLNPGPGLPFDTKKRPSFGLLKIKSSK